MAIKKYISGAWVSTSYRKYGTETDAITSLPAQIIGDGQAITSCQISGNTIQNGTPTPEAPVDVQGVGVRTRNLFPLDATKLHVGCIESDGAIDYNVGTITVGTNSVTYQADVKWRGFYTDFIQAKENNLLTFSPNNSSIMSWDCNCYDENGGFLGKASSQQMALSKTFIMLAGTKKVRISVTSSLTEYTITNPTLNLGSTALPWEPYGYKLPLTIGGTEYPIYLGQVETTRRIRKLVLTGDENWSVWYGNYYSSVIDRKSRIDTILCTHFINSREVGISYAGYSANGLRIAAAAVPFVSSLNDLTAWIAAQYAAGTPVTAWYVLATPETGIVNEPLHKIGDYADTVVATNVPTTGTTENFDVGTTLKPSEVQLTYHGWHEHTDTKYTQGE